MNRLDKRRITNQQNKRPQSDKWRWWNTKEEHNIFTKIKIEIIVMERMRLKDKGKDYKQRSTKD